VHRHTFFSSHASSLAYPHLALLMGKVDPRQDVDSSRDHALGAVDMVTGNHVIYQVILNRVNIDLSLEDSLSAEISTDAERLLVIWGRATSSCVDEKIWPQAPWEVSWPRMSGKFGL